MHHFIVMPTLFGVEALTAGELKGLGFAPEAIEVQNGQVRLKVESALLAETVAKLNYWLRTAERVLIELWSFEAKDFDQLYDGMEAKLWSEILPKGAAFEITGYSRKSKLFGISACQSLIKKAAVTQLMRAQGQRGGTLLEDKKLGYYRFQFGIVDDIVTLWLDTTGQGLHKRGYRPLRHEAPLRESLAASMLLLSFYERNRAHGEALYDPFCGSGTLPIEAALIAGKRAPGLKRHFSAERFPIVGKAAFDRQREYAKLEACPMEGEVRIFGSDIDAKAIEVAKANAKAAGVLDFISFERRDAKKLNKESLEAICGTDRILLVANPPYGERLMDPSEAAALVRGFGQGLSDEKGLLPGLRLSLLSSDTKIERQLGVKADKTRKLYNGALACKLYQYFKLRRN